MPLNQLLFGFNGRIRRSQYWLTWLACILVLCVVNAPLFFMLRASYDPYTGTSSTSGLAGIAVLVMFGLYIPAIWIGLALQVKRWHDRDKSGWWVLIGLIPFGGLWVLIECGFLDGTQGPNKFGPSPKGIGDPNLAQTFS